MLRSVNIKRDILFYQYSDKMLAQLKKGAFLVVATPIVGDCELHYECKIVYK